MRTRLPSPTDREAYDRDGFVLLHEAFSAEEIARIGNWTDEVAARPEESGRHWVYHERSLVDGSRLVARIERIEPFHEGFRALTEAFVPAASAVLGEPALLFKEKVNFKMPGGDGFKPHQDSQAGWEKYARRFVTVALAIDDASLENGCMSFAAGQHRRGLFREWEPMNDRDMAGMDFRPVPMAAGDLVLLDSYAPHGSEPNFSGGVRRMYFATYNAASEGDHKDRYYADKHKSYPPDIDREKGRDYVFRV
jgi:2-aminoethylphosphonate dioxygenase